MTKEHKADLFVAGLAEILKNADAELKKYVFDKLEEIKGVK
jgi:hypothetical protein